MKAAVAVWLIVALAAYDIGRAATTRCVRPADRLRILSLDDMDELPGVTHFLFDVVADRKPLQTAPLLAVRRGTALRLRGAAYDDENRRIEDATAFAVVDGLDVLAMDVSSGEARVTIPPADLPVGSHLVTFDVVPSDLRGYFIPLEQIRIHVR